MFIRKIPILAAVSVVTACLASSAAIADPPSYAPVNFLPAVVPVEGARSSIQRNDAGFRLNIVTNSLQHQIYTVWLLVWNDPANDADCPPANGGDFCTPGTMDCVIFGAGHLIGESGNAAFSSHLSVGDTSRVVGGGNCPAGLIDARAAEVHAVIGQHGELEPSTVLPDEFRTPVPPAQFEQATVHVP